MWDFFRVTPRKRQVKLKNKNGVLYSNPNDIKKIIFYIGDFLFIIALGYLIYLYLPLGSAYINYMLSNNSQLPVPTSAPIIHQEITPTPVLTEPKVISSEYTIEIPRISAKATVASNVSPFDPKEYLKALDNGQVAQSSTSANPGEALNKSIFIFAHSTAEGWTKVRNNAVFYLLGELKDGDVVNIDYHGTKYTYQIYQRKIVKASDTSYLYYSESGKEVLVLQTCWPVGTDWNRLLVFGELVKSL